jgi:hypothetical protein
MGDKMTYRVALNDKQGDEKGRMAGTWMAAAGRNGIPSAFLVDTKGIIAWIGQPMQLKEKMIEDVLGGKFDVRKAAAEYEQQQQNERRLRSVGTALSRAMQQNPESAGQSPKGRTPQDRLNPGWLGTAARTGATRRRGGPG